MITSGTTTGTRLQLAFDAVDAYCGQQIDERQAIVRAKIRGLLRGYDARWSDAGYLALSVEQTFEHDLFNPDTGKPSRTFTTAGKLDAVASLSSRRFVIDHKTTSEDISDPNAPYWQQLAIEGQATHYMLLEWLGGNKPDGAVWDVTRKPLIRPKKLTKAERTLAVADRKYFGRSLTQQSLDSLQVNESETLEMYESRLAHDCTIERPEWYFQRRSVPRLDSEMLEYAQDLWEQAHLIRESRKRPRLPKHTGACLMYGSPCRFLGICSGHDSPDSERWQRKAATHRELGPEVSKEALTNSRIRCFQVCPTKHYYEYELGIERVDEEEREALFFGTLFHEGLRAWWETFLENHDVDSESRSEANGVSEQFAS